MYLCAGVLSTLLVLVSSYPGGAPHGSCTYLLPGHGRDSARNQATPYTISTSKATFGPGDKVTFMVTKNVESAEDVAGYMLQVRKVGGSDGPQGVFEQTQPQGKTRLCSKSRDTVTQNSDDPYTTLFFTWVAPQEDIGDVMLTGSLLESEFVYWGNVKSATISFRAPTTTAPPPVPVVTVDTDQENQPKDDATATEATTTTKATTTTTRKPYVPDWQNGGGSSSSEESSEESSESLGSHS